MFLRRLFALLTAVAAAAVSPCVRAQPSFRPDAGGESAASERYVRDLLLHRPYWMRIDYATVPVPQRVPDYLITVRQIRGRIASAAPDDMSVPPLLGGFNLGTPSLRFGPVEPNCMQSHSLAQQFLNPKVSRETRKIWAQLNDEPFPITEPDEFRMLRAIISPGVTKNFGGMDSLGAGLRLAPDKGFWNSYCVNASYIHRF